MDCSFVRQLLQTNVAHDACVTPGGESGHCRHLRFCVLNVFTASYGNFLPYFCRITRLVLHYCCERCSIGKVLCVITGKWHIVTKSDVANLLQCSITTCILLTQCHTCPKQATRTIVFAATYEQQFPLDHYHLRPPKCGFGGPKFILRVLY